MTIPHAHIGKMAPYALADLGDPTSETISLSQNESFRPPSPAVIEAVNNSLSQTMLYPDPDWTELRLGLAKKHSISPANILCGNGSLNLIAAIAQVYSGADRAVLAPIHAYPFFRTAAALSGARFDVAAETDATVSIAALLDAVRPDTGLVCIANPGNPTGTRISKDQLVTLRNELRDDILLIIDEAYGEFADYLGERCFDMVDRGNTVVLRTFSKAYGLAGHRVGWGLFPEKIGREVRKVLNPNNVSMLSQVAAVAALEDDKYMRETCEQTIRLRDQAADEIRQAGFKVYPSHTNFILIDCGGADQADELDLTLRNDDIFLRKQGGAGLPHMLRMTVGPRESMRAAIDRMTEWRRTMCA